MGQVRDVIDAVRAGLADERRVVVAYVFGSQLGRPRPDSDVDVAVLLDPPPRSAEKARLIRELAGTLGRQMRADKLDLVFLDDAPPALAFQVVKHGRVALCRDPAVLHRFKVATYRRHADRESTERFFREVTRRRARREAPNG